MTMDRLALQQDVIKRGDVYLADLSPTVGSEQGGVRYALVISNNRGNKHSTTVIVAAISSQVHKGKLPTHVFVPASRYNFEKDSIIMLEQVRTIDKQRLSHKIASLDDEMMKKVKAAHEISCSEMF
jgi:mRNA interferase MazF